MPELKVLTFNVRGLRQVTKRRSIFRFLHVNFPNYVVVLQETHSNGNDNTFWQREWGSQIILSHGRSGSECGVAVLMPKSLQGTCTVNATHIEENGRLLILDLAFENCCVKLIAVYAPTQNKQREQLEFFTLLNDKIESLSDVEKGYLLICGDMNAHLTERETSNVRFRPSNASRKLNNILQEHDLIDLWRHKNPELTRYTWKRLTAPVQQSRIDYIFGGRRIISNHVVNRSEIKPSILSDHSIVTAEIVIFASNKGPGLFRFRNDLLQDSKFIHLAKLEMQKATTGEEVYCGISDWGLKLELLSSNIRVISIRRWKEIGKERRKENEKFMLILEKCESQMATNPSDELIQQYQELKNVVNDIEEEKGKRAMVFSGARWIEEGERPTKYFLNLSRNRKIKKEVNVLQTDDNMLVTGNTNILNFCRDYFKNLYSTTQNNLIDDSHSLCREFLGTLDFPQLTDEDRALTDAPITNIECKAALDVMANNKSPSVSGFSKEFFQFFWLDLETILMNYINQAKSQGHFFVTQRRAVITMIPKKGDQKKLKNKRAICLLDIVYKIVAKVLANRIMRVIPKLVAPDQTGSIRGRNIGFNLRMIDDVIKYSNKDNLNGILIALDFQNAFNTVEHGFIYDTLRTFGFGSLFIQWIQLLHKDTELAIINNGYTSHWFNPSRGLQQGCPSSSLLFCLVVEILAIKIRASENVKGIKVSQVESKISQYIDDTTLFVDNADSAENALEIINNFGKISGLQLNLEKSQFMWLGASKCSCHEICGATPSKQVKILGIQFSASENCDEHNIQPIVGKIQNTLNQWSQRDLTLKGKITIAKSLIISRLIYITSVVSINQKCLNMIQSKIMRFIWRGRPPKVSRDVLFQDIASGGMNAPNVESIYKSIRVSWFGKLFANKDLVSSRILLNRLGLKYEHILHMNYGDIWIKTTRISSFYTEMLRWLRECLPVKEPTNGTEVRMQLIWNNVAIRVGGKPIFSLALYRRDIILVDDLFDNEGQAYTYEQFKQSYPGLKLNRLVYMSWYQAIPLQWRRWIAGSERLSPENRLTKPTVHIKSKEVNIKFISSKFFRSKWLREVTPSAQIRWTNEAINFGDNWKKIYSLPFRITQSTKLQNLQFRILHRFFPTKRYLCVRSVVDDPFCDQCGEIETIQHFFLNCECVRSFWVLLVSKMNQRLEQRWKFDMNERNIIFGSIEASPIINFIILNAKQFIVSQRFSDGNMDVNHFVSRLLRLFKIELYTAKRKGRLEQFKSRWRPFVDEELRLSF